MNGPDERPPLRRALRDAADPRLDHDAAARIADGAWRRAADLRREAAPTHSVPRPLVWATAAAATLVAAVALSLRDAEPALAVTGDPVQVLDGGRWRDARQVADGSWIFVPPGARRIVAPDGSELLPKPGAVFRAVCTTSRPRSGSWRVEVRCGDADVRGAAFVLALDGTIRVDGDGARAFGASVTVGAAAESPPASPESLSGAGTPFVAVTAGAVRVANLRDPEFMVLGADQSAFTFRVAEHGTTRLVRSGAWSPQVLVDAASGANLVATATLPGGNRVLALRSPGGDLRGAVLPREGADVLLLQVAQLTAERLAGAIAPPVVGAEAPAQVTAEYRAERDGHVTMVMVLADGRACVRLPGGEMRTYATLDALRAGEAAVAELFGDRLR